MEKLDDLLGITRSPLVGQQVDEGVDQEEREGIETRDQESVDRDQLQLAPFAQRDETPCLADSGYEPEVLVRQSDRPPERSRSRWIETVLHTIGKPR